MISPLGVEASLQAIETLQTTNSEQRQAFELQLRQLDYEVQKAFEQYNAVDARNRLVAAELEKRWNAKMESREELERKIEVLAAAQPPLTVQQVETLRELGRNFAQVWHHVACPIEVKKKIVHTVIEEVVVKLDQETQGDRVYDPLEGRSPHPLRVGEDEEPFWQANFTGSSGDHS